MYTVSKVDTPDRGTLFAVGAGTDIVSRFADEDEAKEFCLSLNGGEAGEKRLKKAEEKAKEAAEKAEEANKARAPKDAPPESAPPAEPLA